jgi:hypothetical protein
MGGRPKITPAIPAPLEPRQNKEIKQIGTPMSDVKPQVNHPNALNTNPTRASGEVRVSIEIETSV